MLGLIPLGHYLKKSQIFVHSNKALYLTFNPIEGK
jgi:hypothetical protein